MDWVGVASSILKNTDWLSAGASFLEGVGDMTSGNTAAAGARSEAAQLRQNASAALATGTRQSYEQRRQGERLKSDAVALNAAGGGGMDTAMLERMARIEADTEYSVLARLYEGQTQSAALRYAARAKEEEARASSRNSMLSAIPSILDLGDQIFTAAGMGSGKKSTPSARHSKVGISG